MPRYPTIINRASFTRFFLQSEFAFSSIPGLAMDLNPLSPLVNGGSPNNGDPIQTLVDNKDSNKTYEQVTASKRPLWVQSDADFSNNPSMSFDSFDDFLLYDSAFGSNKGAFIGVVKLNSLQLQVLVASADTSYSNKYLQFCTPHSSYQYQYIEVNNVSNVVNIRGTNSLSVGSYIVSVISSGSQWDFWLTNIDDGETIISFGNTGSWFTAFTGRDNVTFGMLKRNVEVGPFDGKIARLLVYDNVTLSTTQIQLIHASLMNKYGVS
jgi:hypothetical protein